MSEVTPHPLNGIPRAIAFEDSEELSVAVEEHTETSAENLVTMLIEKLAGEPGGGAPGGGGGNGHHAKSIKRHNWIAVIMAALLGPGGAIAVIYATSDRSKENAIAVEHMGRTMEEDDKHEKRQSAEIKRISDLQIKAVRTLGQVERRQVKVLDGIEQLKEESVNELKSDLADAKRELRRRER